MSLKDIKLRMDAINKTATITQAMHNIALSKIRKATEIAQRTVDFSNKLKDIVKYANANTTGHSKYCGETEGKHRLYILITADRGLCGSYHNQLYKAFLKEVENLPKKDYKVLTIGKKGFYFGQKQELPMINSKIIYHRDDIVAMNIDEYATAIKDSYDAGYVDEVIVLYNHYVNTATQTLEMQRILPLDMEDEKVKSNFIYDSDPQVVMERTVRIYLQAKIFEALADAKLSEHASRMLAMKSATDNAHQIVDRLHMQYHRARQQEITSELIDVVNGSNV